MRWMFLLQTFFPSWNFFSDVGSEISLEYRTSEAKTLHGPWTPVLPPIRRSAFNFPLNSQGNFIHACRTNLERFAVEITSTDENEIQSLTSYKTIEQMVRFQILAQTANLNGLTPASQKTEFSQVQYQFRILVDSQEVLTSPFTPFTNKS